MAQWLFPVCNLIFKGTMRLFAQKEIEGRANVPTSGPVILASNHLSNVDPAILAAEIDRPPLFLAKKELFKFPLFGALLRGYGAYPVDRTGADLEALNWAASRLAEDRVLILFPEGTRSRGQGLGKGRLGVGYLAARTGAAIVPVGLTGSEPLQNVLLVFKPSANIRLQFGAPFRVRPAYAGANRNQLSAIADEIMQRIAAQLPESYRGQYAAFDSADGVYTETIATAGSPAGTI